MNVVFGKKADADAISSIKYGVWKD